MDKSMEGYVSFVNKSIIQVTVDEFSRRDRPRCAHPAGMSTGNGCGWVL